LSWLRHCASSRKFCEFDSRWYHRNFSLTLSYRPHYGHGSDSASNINEYHDYFLWSKGGRCVGMTSLPPSYADCFEIWVPTPSRSPWACNRPVQGLFYHLQLVLTACLLIYLLHGAEAILRI